MRRRGWGGRGECGWGGEDGAVPSESHARGVPQDLPAQATTSSHPLALPPDYPDPPLISYNTTYTVWPFFFMCVYIWVNAFRPTALEIFPFLDSESYLFNMYLPPKPDSALSKSSDPADAKDNPSNPSNSSCPGKDEGSEFGFALDLGGGGEESEKIGAAEGSDNECEEQEGLTQALRDKDTPCKSLDNPDNPDDPEEAELKRRRYNPK